MKIIVTVTETQFAKGLEILKAAQDAIAKELDKKKRLGQSAVIWQDGQPVLVDAETAINAKPVRTL